jgi:hypothetical protein
MRSFFTKFVTTVLLGAFLMLVLTGCTATKSVIITYDAEGRITSRSESQESVVKEITASTANKTVVAWESGWAAYISGSTATNDDPTPHVKMFAGKTDKGVISALPDQKGWDGIAEAIKATKYELKLTPNGVSSAGTAAASDPSATAARGAK